MILKSIKLENIRSYDNQEIKFPLGSILLSGNIGSGKSSVLLAVEFALFGLRRDTGLLRNGAAKGSVELTFSIDNKEVVIKRVLKRSKTSVTQDTGYVIVNGEKRELTAIELKQFILELLKYPQDLLSKSKELIYRYTVYTPQEEMKHILFSDSESRLDILRRVFGIDRYKRIIENSRIYSSYLKDRINQSSVLIKDLDDKIEIKDSKEKEIRKLDEKVKELKPSLNEIKNNINESRDKIKNYEGMILELNASKKDLELNEMELRNKLMQRKKYQEDIEELDRYIKTLKGDIKEIKETSLREYIDVKNNEIKLMENTIRELISKIKEFEIKKKVSDEVKEKISSLDICPLCKQNVGKEHKHEIIDNENKNQVIFLEGIKNYKDNEKFAEEKLKKIREEIEELRKDQSEIEINRIRISTLKEKEDKKIKISSYNDDLKKDIGIINVNKEKILEKINSFKNVEKEYISAREELEKRREKEKELELKVMGFNKEIEGIKREYDVLEKDINNKLKLKEELGKISKVYEWMDNHFVDLVSVMEKQIMAKVHSDFSSFFEKWFNILVDDDTIKIKLDEGFTPIIIHNGYDLDYENLSGGEKTAAALAYRLSLNQVINNISHIKTKDLIILDEPTDGFSSEQLDRIRIILDELNMKQIIIVSHDPKIEGFVDTIMRLDKKSNSSKLL